MAKLTDRQKNNILAKWHTGQYTKTELAKMYKVDETTIRRITDKQEPKSADLVEAGAKLEILKKADKTPIETIEINKAIKKRESELSIADEIESVALDGTLLNVKSIRRKIEAEELENMREHRDAQETLDKALVTAGKAPRHANTTINNTNATQNNFTPAEISQAIAAGLPD